MSNKESIQVDIANCEGKSNESILPTFCCFEDKLNDEEQL